MGSVVGFVELSVGGASRLPPVGWVWCTGLGWVGSIFVRHVCLGNYVYGFFYCYCLCSPPYCFDFCTAWTVGKKRLLVVFGRNNWSLDVTTTYGVFLAAG